MLAFLLILLVLDLQASREICQDAICEFNFVIRRLRTMTYRSTSNGRTYNVAFNGSHFTIPENSFRMEEYDDMIGKVVDGRDVITADGHVRNVIVINDQFPGPNIEVMEGSQVVVHVTNNLLTDGTTIHWHGLLMKGSPWMDGVAYVTQCPILPRQTFTYRFKADPVGTHWYHAHFTSQRQDGLFGQLIIHNRLPPNPEFLLTLMDWWRPDAESVEITNPFRVTHQGTGEVYIHPTHRRFAVDNHEVTSMTYYSTLLNGRGRGDTSPLPLTKFTVHPSKISRFRMTHNGAEYSYIISIDNHQLQLVASDGGEISPIVVDFFMMHPGETMDFELTANESPGLYWLRATTLGIGVGRNPIPDDVIHEGNAIVRYVGSISEGDPISLPRECTEEQPCDVFNCPFAGYPESHNKHCISITEARSLLSASKLREEFGLDDPNFEEHFFNFNFAMGANVNGRKFVVPRGPLHQNYSNYIKECDPNCEDNGCMCTYIKPLPANKTLQFVITNYSPGHLYKEHHVIHLHGHNFAVLKAGYPSFNRTTGFWDLKNPDIACNNALCSAPRWNGQPPDLNLQNPPIKDSVVVPSRGYIVIRFRSENPGMWLFHCHQELHFMEGMGMLLLEGTDHQLPPPAGFPQCRDFEWSAQDYEDYNRGDYEKDEVSKPCDNVTPKPRDPEDGDYDNCNDNGAEMITMTGGEFVGLAIGFLCLGVLLSVLPMLCYIVCVGSRTFFGILERLRCN